jgi:hypothetical protein
LRPYNTRKLAYRSKQCVFLGYYPRHKGVKCLEISTGRVYISRDVVFDETVFPFASLHPNAGTQLRKELLLLPDLLNPSVGGTNNDDYMPNTCSPMPVVSSMQETEENMEENDADLLSNGPDHRMQTSQTVTDPGNDSLQLSGTGSGADPPDIGAESASSSPRTASAPSPPRHSRSPTSPAHAAPPARAATRSEEVGSLIRPKRISFPEHFCYCFSSNLYVLNTTNTD